MNLKMNHNEKLTDLEFAAINKLCECLAIETPVRSSFYVASRDLNEVGCVINLAINESVKKIKYGDRVFDNLPNAIVGLDKTQIGFVCYFESGFLTDIEYFSYGDKLHSDENVIKFLKPSRKL